MKPPLRRHEVPLLSTRNRLAGKVSSIRTGELLAEIAFELPP
jgi:molybdopterin-binding protein